MSCVLPKENVTVSRGMVCGDGGHGTEDHLRGLCASSASTGKKIMDSGSSCPCRESAKPCVNLGFNQGGKGSERS